jgi:AsmA-like C-terminal region
VFDIQRLHLQSAGSRTSMDYQAVLTNATPPGLIHSQGTFGPFNSDEFGKTPVSGKYQFRDADLSVFKGISGKLASDGEFKGTLGNIEVNGTTDIPDFQVRESGHPVELKAEFHAVVDGTNGDTQLDPINVQFKNSQLVARGKVDGVPGMNGKAVALDVAADDARIEDLLMMVVKDGEPPLRGQAKFHTSFVLSPGKGDVLDRLRLSGSFGLEQTKFAKSAVQEKIAKLSTKAQGRDKPAGDTASDFHGNFTLENAVARFSELRFDVPGAQVSLEGDYNVDSERLDFHGHLTMDAKLSQMTTGVKSFFAKIVEPLVTKHDDTVIPIKITGTRQQPKFGVEVGKLLKGK